MGVVAIGLGHNPLVAVVASVVSAGVGAYFLSVITGNLGRRLQDKIWLEWGGVPTAQLLRVLSEESNPTQRGIWRNAIEDVTGVSLMSATQERNNAVRADQTITAAIGQVRHLGQDARYPLIGAENAQYGFERNMFGARWLGRGLAVLGVVGVAADLFLVAKDPSSTLVIGLCVEVVLLLVWCILPSKNRMREAAFRYGEQLLQAVVRESKAAKPAEGGPHS